MTPTAVDLVIQGGQVLTMDATSRVIERGSVAVRHGQIVGVGTDEEVGAAFVADHILDARHKVVMPGLVDTYGHAGHGLIKGIHHPRLGWPTNQVYFHATTRRWWYAEGLLSALERLKFGVTCGFSVVGATPARMDSPIFAEAQAEALQDAGVRGVLGVGPPDPFVTHLPKPWAGTRYEDGQSHLVPFSYEDALQNSVYIIERWHGAAGRRIHIALHYPYLFGRQAAHPRIPFTYTSEHVPRMIEKAEEVRDLSARHGVLTHSHAFRGSVAFAIEQFGLDRARAMLDSDVLLAHCNGLEPAEVELLGAAKAGIAVVPFTHENILYGVCPVIELLQAGATVTISTDGTAPYCSYDLLAQAPRAIWAEWVRSGDQSMFPPGKALRMVTIDAARALGLDHLIGSLEVGKRADIVLINLASPHLTPSTIVPRQLVFYATGADVDTVLVDGKILMRGRKVLTMDEEAVLGMAREEAALAFRLTDVSPYCETGQEFWEGWRH